MTAHALSRRWFGLAIASALAIPMLAQADTWPSKPVRWVVAYPAGGGSDFLARQLAPQLGKQLGQTMVIDNRPGAGGVIGTDNAAKSPPDGYTIVMGAVATHAINPALYAKMPYDPLKYFTPVTLVASVPNVLVLNPNTPANSVRELVDYAKAHPGKLNFGSGSNGSAGHLAGEMFKQLTGTYMVHIPYAGGNPAQLALLAGQVDLNFDNLAAASANIKAGKLRALAVTTARRSSAMPEVPTIAEAGRSLGLGSFDIDTWFGIFGPAHLPAETTTRLNKAFVDAIESAELHARFASLFAEAMPSSPERFAAFVRSELAKYERVVKASGARIE